MEQPQQKKQTENLDILHSTQLTKQDFGNNNSEETCINIRKYALAGHRL